ncbi:tetratricopeptide repeat protein [Nocardia goodfellowii]|uniref:Tetratricopeptide (TPR) repeat protein n=1 Tax=Nocardia goodfellowii TaxID=882446 RepID=A0ABS4QBB7_9NOCA|nr:tetratricopeptide repeat protein [Nocardia goodfellowii]MBP2188379.1 tetratricopeptide (TPR) repeat protein [Nocardia goodfellowii]
MDDVADQPTAPDDGRAALLPGAAAYQRGDVAEALRIFAEVARTTTGALRISALVNAASMADELGDHTTALTWFREALAEIPADAVEKRCSALINFSQALQHLGELDEAQAALEQARALLADSGDELGMLRVSCLLSLAAVAFHRGHWTRTIEIATESLDAAVRFAPHLAGHPLMNLAGAYFESGRQELALDFAQQALAAFETAGDVNAVAETRQNLATMHLRQNRHEEAEPLLRASQDYFEQAGLGHRAGIGLKTLGFLAEGRDDLAQAQELYSRAYAYFRDSGAVLDAADVQVRLATVAYANGRIDEGEALLEAAYTAYAARGLGLHCAQIDYWHALLLESLLDHVTDPAAVLATGTDLAVTSALAIDAVRHTFPNGNQRRQWNTRIADPAMRLAFRFAYLSGDGQLLADLIETQCAGATLQVIAAPDPETKQLPLDLLDPGIVATIDPDDAETDFPGAFAAGSEPTPTVPRRERTEPLDQDLAPRRTDGPTVQVGPLPADAASPAVTTLRLASALADVAAAEGLPVSLPPRLVRQPDGHVALAPYIAAAEQRYGRPVRDRREVSA